MSTPIKANPTTHNPSTPDQAKSAAAGLRGAISSTTAYINRPQRNELATLLDTLAENWDTWYQQYLEEQKKRQDIEAANVSSENEKQELKRKHEHEITEAKKRNDDLQQAFQKSLEFIKLTFKAQQEYERKEAKAKSKRDKDIKKAINQLTVQTAHMHIEGLSQYSAPQLTEGMSQR